MVLSDFVFIGTHGNMNEKQVKKLRKRIKPLQVEWLKSLLNEEEAEEVTLNNIDSLLPKQTHYFGRGILYLSFMTDKWIMKILKRNPQITLLSELNKINEEKKYRNRKRLDTQGDFMI